MFEVTGKMVWKGTKTGLHTTWELAKVVVPTAIVVAVFRASGILDIITAFFAPYMGLFGLSGEAAIVLFSGYFVNLYAAAGSIMALSLTLKEITICAVMLGFCHSLLVELPISQKAGSPMGYIFLVRLGCSLAMGWLLGVVLP
ncbi:MAG TPA: nucleoside recognition protein [Firmicutes bacterium]|jgi:spore maturation protein SpmB|nr:nucleoside recognition protein [Bacillota bacterium]